MTRIVAIAIAALHALVSATASAQAPACERQRTAAAELARMCEADGGRLWRESLCGPFIWVDRQTRAACGPDDDGVMSVLEPAARRPK